MTDKKSTKAEKTKNGVTKRGTGWGYRFTYRDANGKRRYVRKQGFATKEEAKDAYAKAWASVNRHGVASPTLTVGDYLRGWIERYERSQSRKVTTVLTARRLVDAYLIPRIGHVRLAKLSPAMVANLYADLMDNGKTGQSGQGGLSAKSVRNIGGVLHKALHDAVRDGTLTRNPADDVDLPKWNRPEIHAYDEAQVTAFIRQASKDGDPFLALWWLLFGTGIRRGELCGLRWQDVDLVEGTISIVQTRVQASKVHTTTPKSNASRRRITIDPAAVTMLATLKNAQDEAAERLGGWPSDLVATDLAGKPIRPSKLTDRFNAILRDAGLPKFTRSGPHVARHTHATLMFDHNEPVHVVSRRLGHTSVSFTADIYVASMPSADRAAANTWESIMRSAGRIHDDAK